MTIVHHFVILDDRFKRCVQTDEPLEQLWTGAKYSSGQRHMRRFKVNPDRTFSGGEVFAECSCSPRATGA